MHVVCYFLVDCYSIHLFSAHFNLYMQMQWHSTGQQHSIIHLNYVLKYIFWSICTLLTYKLMTFTSLHLKDRHCSFY